MLDEARLKLDETSAHLAACRFRNGLRSAMSLAQSGNRYLDRKSPWRAVRNDKADAASTLWTAMSVINCLKTAFYPFMPESSERVHSMLGLDDTVKDEGWSWDPCAVKPGTPLPRPKPLFRKLDESLIEEETARLGS